MPYVTMIERDDIDLCVSELLDIKTEIKDKVIKKRIDYIIKTLSDENLNLTNDIGIILDEDTSAIRLCGRRIKVPKMQYDILSMFVKVGLNKLVTFRELAEKLFALDKNVNIDFSIKNNLAVHIQHVNKILKENSKYKISSCRNKGYELVKG